MPITNLYRVVDWYEPIVKQLLVVALAYRWRAIPLVWMWVRSSRGHSTTGRQLALLNYIHKLLPADVSVLLLGDSEFGAVEV